MSKFIGLIQARVGSYRLRNKILMKIKDRIILDYVLERARHSECDDMLICTTKNRSVIN